MAAVADFLKFVKKKNGSALHNKIHNILKFTSPNTHQKLSNMNLLNLVQFFCHSIPSSKDKLIFATTFSQLLNEFSKVHPIELDIDYICKSVDHQILIIEKDIELIKQVGKHLNKKHKDKKIKLKIQNSGVIALVLDDHNCLTVELYSSRVQLQSGQLVPLTPVTQLYYDAAMELREDLAHFFATDDYFYSFTMRDQKMKGYKLSPRDLTIKQSLSGPLNIENDLFFMLKAFEKNYIDLASDPFYQELCGKLDRAIESLKLRQPESILFAKKSIKLAYLALKYVFDDDNYLKYKLLELERTIKAEVEWAKQAQTIKQV